MNVSTLAPEVCNEDKFNTFLKLVEKGGEVISNSLKDRIKNAELLAFCYIGEQLVGVGALKNPAKTYKEKSFRKAGYPEEAENFKYEFGYLYVEEEYRKHGVGKGIWAALKNKIDAKEVFATVREENKIMVSFLKKYGFEKLGNNYNSKRGDYLLGCYVLKIKQ